MDIKDAYHSLRLTEKSKEYCGILPYFGSPIYRYEVLPMGITCAPQIWMDYITLILSELQDKKKYIAIMDDLLIHSTKMAHWKLLEQLLKSMCKNGLSVVLLPCGCLSLNPFIEISIRNNSSSSDVLNIQASISISPKFESK